MKLLGIPYAGGSGNIFYKMEKYLHPAIELTPIELPGRGKRMMEEPISSFGQALKEIIKMIENETTQDEDYLLLGYSYGSMLAFEAVRRLRNLPKHLFLAAFEPPMYYVNNEKFKNLSDWELIEKVILNDDNQLELREKNEILLEFVPLIRADFAACADYQLKDRKNKAHCSSSILYSSEESNRIKNWDRVFLNPCQYRKFDGKHFFIRENYKSMAEIINEEYLKIASKPMKCAV